MKVVDAVTGSTLESGNASIIANWKSNPGRFRLNVPAPARKKDNAKKDSDTDKNDDPKKSDPNAKNTA